MTADRRKAVSKSLWFCAIFLRARSTSRFVIPPKVLGTQRHTADHFEGDANPAWWTVGGGAALLRRRQKWAGGSTSPMTVGDVAAVSMDAVRLPREVDGRR